MISSIDELQDEVERLLRKCTPEIVKVIATEWKIEPVDGRDKRALLRDTQQILDDTNDSDEKVNLFKGLIPLLPDDLQPRLKKLLKLDTVVVAGDVTADSKELDKEEDGSPEKKRGEEGATTALVKLLGLQSAGTSTFRKECRISGITDDNKKINYISLCKEMGEAKRKGFKSFEIVSAIRKAIQAGELRTYLDSFPVISLEETLTLIRSAYKEKSATELFRELDKLCQRQNEEGPASLFRALSLRQRILKPSEVEGEVQYHRSQVPAVFVHSLRTGLLHEPVRMHMAPFLDETFGGNPS